MQGDSFWPEGLPQGVPLLVLGPWIGVVSAPKGMVDSENLAAVPARCCGVPAGLGLGVRTVRVTVAVGSGLTAHCDGVGVTGERRGQVVLRPTPERCTCWGGRELTEFKLADSEWLC